MNFKQLNKQIEFIQSSLNQKYISYSKIQDHNNELTKDDIEIILKILTRRYKIANSDCFNNLFFTDGYYIIWKYTLNKEELDGGEINLAPSSSFLVNTLESASANKLLEFEKGLYKQGFRYFDSAGELKFAITIEGETINPQVHLVDAVHEDLVSLELDYPEYIEHSLKLKGLYGWQYLFTAYGFDHFEVDFLDLLQRLEDYKKLFPKSDVSEYIKRYHDYNSHSDKSDKKMLN